MEPQSRATEGRGFALVAFSAACFGAIPIAVTIAQRNGLPLVSTLAWRYGLGTLMLVLLAGTARRAIFRREGLLPLAVLGTMQAGIAGVSLSALSFINAATMSFLFFTFPAWVAVIAAVRRTEPLTTTRVVALGLALAGIGAMVGTPAGGVHPVGVGLALAAALLYAIYIPIIGHFASVHGGFAASTYAAAGAGAVFILFGLLVSGVTAGLVVPGNGAAWAAVGWLAAFSTAVGFLAFLKGLAVLGAVRSAIVATLEPFVTAALGALLLAQALTAGVLIGGAFVAAAVLLLQRAQRPRTAALIDDQETAMDKERIALTIEGMTCEHCVRAVRGRLEKTPGVEVEQVAIGSATVRLDGSTASIDDVQDAISDEGYTAFVASS